MSELDVERLNIQLVKELKAENEELKESLDISKGIISSLASKNDLLQAELLQEKGQDFGWCAAFWVAVAVCYAVYYFQ